MEIRSPLFSALECRCGGSLSLAEVDVACGRCGSKFDTFGKNPGIIFEEVFEAPEDDRPPVRFPEKMLESVGGSWRLQNYRLSKAWVDKFSKADILVDLGSGPQRNSELFKGKDVLYVDGARYAGVDIVCDFAKRLPIRGGAIAGVLCSNVLEHLPEPQTCFDEIFRILRAAGRALVLVPFLFKLHQEPYDFHRYTRHALNRYAIRAGFRDVRIIEVGNISNVLAEVLVQAEKEAANPVMRFGLAVQNGIWRIWQRFSQQSSPSKIMPQGYAVYLEK